MSLILIKDTGIDFGDFSLATKSKEEVLYNNDNYKVKTFKEITRLEKNGRFIYESVPGTRVTEFKQTERGLEFFVESCEKNIQISLELEANKEYRLKYDDINIDKIVTNMSGKISISVELTDKVKVKLEKIDG